MYWLKGCTETSTISTAWIELELARLASSSNSSSFCTLALIGSLSSGTEGVLTYALGLVVCVPPLVAFFRCLRAALKFRQLVA
jgi:hypothetical protein